MGRWVDWKPVMQEASKAEEVGGDMPLGPLARHSHLMSRWMFFKKYVVLRQVSSLLKFPSSGSRVSRYFWF